MKFKILDNIDVTEEDEGTLEMVKRKSDTVRPISKYGRQK